MRGLIVVSLLAATPAAADPRIWWSPGCTLGIKADDLSFTYSLRPEVLVASAHGAIAVGPYAEYGHVGVGRDGVGGLLAMRLARTSSDPGDPIGFYLAPSVGWSHALAGGNGVDAGLFLGMRADVKYGWNAVLGFRFDAYTGPGSPTFAVSVQVDPLLLVLGVLFGFGEATDHARPAS